MSKQLFLDKLKKTLSGTGFSSAWSSAGRSVQYLSVALGVQILLACVLFWQSAQTAQFSAADNLFVLDEANIDAIRIEDGENEIRLSRGDTGWQLKSEGDNDATFPADSARVDTALASLSDLSAGLAVANSESSQAQLEVAEDRFQRRLRLSSKDDNVLDIYLGTSPGFRKAHMRKAEESAIFAAHINVYDLPVSADEWLDKQLLAFSDVKRIGGEGFKLELKEDTWSLLEPAEIPADKELNVAKVSALVESLQSLNVDGLGEILVKEVAAQSEADTQASSDENAEAEAQSNGDDSKDEAVLMNGVLSITANGKEIELSFAQLDDQATVSRNDVGGVFSVAENVVENFAEFSLDNMLIEKKTETDKSADKGEMSEAEKAMESLTDDLVVPLQE